MHSNAVLPSLFNLKGEARALREMASADGKPLSHQSALHAVAKKYGFKNWETMLAASLIKPAVAPLSPESAAVSKDVSSTVADAELRANRKARHGWPLGEVKPQVLFSLDGELYVRSENYGDSVTARLVYPAPPRTTVRRFPASTFVLDPSPKEWKSYDAAYGR